jgi:hypothetical protein
MVISLGPFRDRPRRRLRGGSRLSASASNLIAAGSEIAAGRIALFTPADVATGRHLSLLLSFAETVNANLDCQRVATFPRLSPGTLALCSMKSFRQHAEHADGVDFARRPKDAPCKQTYTLDRPGPPTSSPRHVFSSTGQADVCNKRL